MKTYKEFASDKKAAMNDFIGGAIATLAAYQQFKQGEPVCKAAFSKTPEFQWSTSKFLNYMKHDFKKSFKDFDNGVQAYEQGDYEKTGETIARIFQKMDSNKELATADKKINGNQAMDVAEVI